MKTKNNTDAQGKMSFIEMARRSQIIDCAIEVIADRGYAQASLAHIGKLAGISKGVISYHFANKEELIKQVVSTVYHQGAMYMLPLIEKEITSAGRLSAYIKANLAYMEEHAKQITAVTDIIANARNQEGDRIFGIIAEEATVSPLINLLALGQQQGEFRTFNIRMMAMTIRDAIDGVGFQLAGNPDLDLKTYAIELAEIFQLATSIKRSGS